MPLIPAGARTSTHAPVQGFAKGSGTLVRRWHLRIRASSLDVFCAPPNLTAVYGACRLPDHSQASSRWLSLIFVPNGPCVTNFLAASVNLLNLAVAVNQSKTEATQVRDFILN